MLMCMVQCVHLSPVLALLSMFLEYDTEPVEEVTKEVNYDKEGKFMMTGLDVRLEAVGDYYPCCYPLAQCIFYGHARLHGTLDINVELPTELMFHDLLDRAWYKFEEYKAELSDGMPVVQNKLVYLLHAINIDLGQAEYDDEEDDQLSFFASANTSEAMPSTQSGLRAGMGYCFMLVGALLQVSVSRTDNSAYPS